MQVLTRQFLHVLLMVRFHIPYQAAVGNLLHRVPPGRLPQVIPYGNGRINAAGDPGDHLALSRRGEDKNQ